jgi:site-specific recombinase XerD
MQRNEPTMEYIKDFGEYLTGVGKVENTVNSYTGDVKGFIRFLSKRDITF